MEDIQILRELAKKVAACASDPINEEKKRLWTKNNMLKPERPMVIMDQLPWHELEIGDELTLKCKDDFNRLMEQNLRRRLYTVSHFQCDSVVDNFVFIPIALENFHYGISPKTEALAYDDKNFSAQSLHFDDVILSEEDAYKIVPGKLSINKKLQNFYNERYHAVYDDILILKPGGLEASFQLWDFIVQLHTVEKSLYDLIDNPDLIHLILKRMTFAALDMIDQLEELSAVQEFSEYIHCTGAFYDWKVKENVPHKNSAQNAWTFGMSQIFSSVSPQMHEEFEFPYLDPIFKRYGNVYYGCCEPLHNKIEMIRKYKNVRKISMSPWADKEIGAENIGKDFVFSNKPNPAFLAKTSFDEDEIRKDLTQTCEICKKNKTPLEIVLKDVSTVRYEPERLFKWAKIAMEVVLK